jgi:hypothetical protein
MYVQEAMRMLASLQCAVVGHRPCYRLEFEEVSDGWEPGYVRCCVRCGSTALQSSSRWNLLSVFLYLL